MMALSFEVRRRRRFAVALVALCFSIVASALTFVSVISGASAQSVRPPEGATSSTPPSRSAAPVGTPAAGAPVGVIERTTDASVWRDIRKGKTFTVSIPDKKAALLVQSEGDGWRAFRNGPLKTYGVYALGGVLVLLLLFFVVRGRIRVDSGMSGVTITRFNGLERFGHWLLAVSFIVLAITGLNVSYGRYFLPDLIGKDAFASLTIMGKWVHNNVAWAFMLGLALVFLMWVAHNIPSRTDLKWLAKGGGLFSKGVHPDSRKFNAGQKLIFWSTILLGASLSASGVALLFPFETAMMSKTFSMLNIFGFGLPTDLTPVREMQLQSLWHSIVALAMIVIIVAHIYIGSLGMQGAFAAMGSGEVDRNWAKEHHNLWVAEEDEKARRSGASHGVATPAE
ncbi:MAG: formate dehydrogenase subunit gamma [Neomegalonema sp.]|nr:formate dehydrogenase subunit gamma [Neomegalonema sp.]